jgi:branched-chain amino acid transport system substrate-binding protein
MRRSLLVLASLLAACPGGGGGGTETTPEPAAAPPKIATLAVIVPTSGPNAAVGNEMADAVRLASDAWGPKFEAKGYTLQVTIQDDASDPKQAVSAAYAVTGDASVFGVVAHLNSGCFLPASEVYVSANVMAISPSATNVEITKRGMKQIARVTPHDGVQGELAAEFVGKQLALKKVAVIHDKTQYGQGIAEVFQNHGKTIGLDIVSFDGIQVGDKDFKALLTKVKSLGPDGIFFGGLYDEAGFLVKQARELGITARFLAPDGTKGQDFFDVGGAAVEGSIVSFPGAPIENLTTAQDFLSAFQTKFGRPVQNYGPYAFDTANILFTAALKAIEASAPDLRAAVVDNTLASEHVGALGTTKFDAHGDTLNQQFSFFEAVAGGSWKYRGTATQGQGITVPTE